jgi:hypothetical protein
MYLIFQIRNFKKYCTFQDKHLCKLFLKMIVVRNVLNFNKIWNLKQTILLSVICPMKCYRWLLCVQTTRTVFCEYHICGGKDIRHKYTNEIKLICSPFNTVQCSLEHFMGLIHCSENVPDRIDEGNTLLD